MLGRWCFETNTAVVEGCEGSCSSAKTNIELLLEWMAEEKGKRELTTERMDKKVWLSMPSRVWTVTRIVYRLLILRFCTRSQCLRIDTFHASG